MKQPILVAIALSAIGIISVVALYGTLKERRGYNEGYSKGYANGVSKALDTVRTLMDKRINNTPPAVTALIIEDTLVYYLSKKTLIP
jgi:hypothetical protein